MRPWECELLYWQTVLWHRLSERLAKKLPVDKLEHLIEEEMFDEKLAELEAADAARGLVVDPTTRSIPPVEIVSRWSAEAP